MESKPPKIHVLIVGGGIGGLMLGLMLEKAEISYQILERSPEHRPLGSAISLNGTVLRLFEQLGLLEDVYNISKIAGRLHLVKEDLETQGHVDLEHFRERYGYNNIVFGRPDLFKVLVRHIPPAKLLMGKRILSTSQTELGVMVRCSDGSTYHGDILVGADGAYSSVRQCMHKSLKDDGMLPRADSEKLKFDQHCVVGITDELSPERFPILKAESCEIFGVLGKKQPYTIWLIPITGNRFAWSIGGRILDSEVGHEDVRSFSFAEWCPEMATDLCDLVRDYAMPDFSVPYQRDEYYKQISLGSEDIHDENPLSETASMSDNESCGSGVPSENSPASSSASSTCAINTYASSRRSSHQHSPEALCQIHPLSRVSTTASNHSTEPPHGIPPKRKPPPAKPGTVAEIIDATNPDRISKVMLESKLFKVWHHERTVLLGDACHKLLPFAGQGAIQAILDGVSLANALYDMTSNSMTDITKAFKRYSTERLPIARGAVAGSRSFGKLFNAQGRLSDFIRKISFSRVPPWILKMATDKLHLHRPQLTFMPMVPDRGSAKAHKQEYSPRYLAQMLRGQQASQERSNNLTDTTVPTAPKATAAAEANAESQHTDTEDAPHRDGLHRDGHRSKSHHRHHRANAGSLSHDPEGSRKNSSRSLVPPPLPLEAPPRHHPALKDGLPSPVAFVFALILGLFVTIVFVIFPVEHPGPGGYGLSSVAVTATI
ncbi:hypothetical protein EDD21DRAFT_352157 [Dissophora ornata]|nr:hypothetical protein EDD21DRAFT_352157 [Dissophora ornata]